MSADKSASDMTAAADYALPVSIWAGLNKGQSVVSMTFDEFIFRHVPRKFWGCPVQISLKTVSLDGPGCVLKMSKVYRVK